MNGDGVGSIYESLSADDKRAHGLAASLWIYDEFAQAPNTDLLDNLRTGMGKRNESLGVVISTQAANDQHPLSQMIDDVALGVDPAVYLQLASAPDDADIFDEKTWFACNEALGTPNSCSFRMRTGWLAPLRSTCRRSSPSRCMAGSIYRRQPT